MYKKIDNKEFSKIFSQNDKIFTKYFVVFYINDTHSTFGYVVSRKVGNAVIRNKIKRYLREIITLHQNEIKNKKIIFIPKKFLGIIIKKNSFNNIENDISNAFLKLKNLKGT